MMPHPERVADARLGGTDGAKMFDGLATVLA
jgi:phosphoribosylformylglycinamidine (FGAM) synthase-like amidotransferase family enzyme